MSERDDLSGMDDLITRALERRPEVVVPEGFAARVRASLPVRRVVRRRVSVRGRVGVVMAAVAALVAFGLAPHAADSFRSLVFDVEVVLVVEMVGVVGWLALRRGER